jgi:protein-disulfide isomerase/uncharacterized membrane protein
MRAKRALTICAVLTLIGIGLAGYLAYLHIGLLRGELLGGAACSGSGAFDCHAVTGGSWGSFLGMPLALWGIAGYLVILALALWGRQTDETAAQAATLIALLGSAFVLVDAYLLGIQAFVLKAYCLFCLFTYGVNVLIALSAWGAATPALAGGATAALVPGRQPAAALFWGMVLTAALGVGGFHIATLLLTRGTLGDVTGQIRTFLAGQPRATLDTTGDPVHGPADAKIRLIEFSDFLCPACQKASRFNRIILANHRSDTSLTFKHFPLDNTCNDKVQRLVHPGACQIAAASECAHAQGKFWPFHDRVFEKGPQYKVSDIDNDVRALGLDGTAFQACMDSGEGLEAVKRDIAEAGKIGVQSTPTYVANGIPMAGMMNPSMFDQVAHVLGEGQ